MQHFRGSRTILWPQLVNDHRWHTLKHTCMHTHTNRNKSFLHLRIVHVNTLAGIIAHVSNMLDSVLFFCHVGSEELRHLGLKVIHLSLLSFLTRHLPDFKCKVHCHYQQSLFPPVAHKNIVLLITCSLRNTSFLMTFRFLHNISAFISQYNQQFYKGFLL